ncbi:MAG: polysaccharide biosynthesis/export family protein [Chitinophagales bacterium]|nr:polysaccharide biosynthesis/export family protein [Chitinophagales bacterium]
MNSNHYSKFHGLSKHRNYLLLLIFLAVSASSCRLLNPSKLYTSEKDYPYTTLTDSLPNDYRIRPGDRFELLIFSNNGYKLIDPIIYTNAGGSTRIQDMALDYDVNANGVAYLPMIGQVNLFGLTEREAELLLAEKYKENYISPYIQLRVTNRRVLVYRGNEDAKVVLMTNQNMTIMEAIAAAGGVTDLSRTYRVKLIRNAGTVGQTITLIDLSTVEGLMESGKLVKADDIIYLEPSLNAGFFRELAPIFTAVSTVILVVSFIMSFQN